MRSDDEDRLEAFLDDALGDRIPLRVTPMVGGGSCEVFAVDRGPDRWVLRRAPKHASSSTAHDVLREFRILDAIKDTSVPIARPVVACGDPEVFGGPFYVMDRIEGKPVLKAVPKAWAAAPESHGRALEELVDALVTIHAVDWHACGLGDLAHGDDYLARQLTRWLTQLDSYGGRDLAPAHNVAEWLGTHRPAGQPSALCHGDYKLDNVLFAPESPPAAGRRGLGDGGHRRPDRRPGVGAHLPPGARGHPAPGHGQRAEVRCGIPPDRRALFERYAAGSGHDVTAFAWYDVFARWKLALVLEGSYAKFQRGLSDKPVHEHFGAQVDLLLASAGTIIDRGEAT